MTVLRLHFLGDLKVIRDDEVVPLPPSKKTRALLAYLALNPRAFRREFLCELLWEIPDDPRGSLRWSLSKIRRLVDGADRPRIIADRNQVRLDTTAALVDVAQLKALAGEDLAATPLEQLEQAAAAYDGQFLEGLELPGFHRFYAWCVAEREQVAQARTALLQSLIRRLAAEPERALGYARALADEAPYDEHARAGLIRLLVATGHPEEAEQHYEQGRRQLAELGVESSGLLYQAWRGAPGAASAAPAPRTVLRPATVEPSPLVGRERQLAQLSDALADILSERQARFVLLRGTPGIGKSRLLQYLAGLARENGATLLQASAFESETLRPYGLWIDAWRDLDPDRADRLFGASAWDNRERLLAGLSRQLTESTEQAPVVVLFDDFQWCDESSAGALHYMARLNRQQPILVAIAARDDGLDDNPAVQQTLRGLRHDRLLQEIRLGPLAEEALRQLIPPDAPKAEAETLVRACGGNPLLAIELGRALAAGTAGETLDELVRERLSRFDPEGAEVLHWSALLAPRIHTHTLAALTGLTAESIDEALMLAEAQSLLVATDAGFRFSHELVARSVYNDIAATRKRLMHRRVAELLEQETALNLNHAADLAHHALHSGDALLASRAMVAAGRLCLRFFANADAQSLALKGLQLAERLPESERVCIALELHDILLSAAPVEAWQQAAETYITLAEQALDHGALNHARLGYQMASYLRWAHGEWAGAREESLQAERITRSGNDEQHIIGMAETARCLALLERDLSHADALLMEARALASRRQISIEAIPAALGLLRFHQNQLDEAEELFKEARTLCKTEGNRINEYQANEYLAMIEFERRRYPQALARCQELEEIGERLREGSEAPFAAAFSALCRYALDDDGGALERSLDPLRSADAKHRLSYILTRAALLDIERDRPRQALDRAGEALECARCLERATEMLLAQLVLALAYRAEGDEAAARCATDAIAALENAPAADWARRRVEQHLGKPTDPLRPR